MRLAGIKKGGYYPYPPQTTEATASGLSRFQRAHVGESTFDLVQQVNGALAQSCQPFVAAGLGQQQLSYLGDGSYVSMRHSRRKPSAN